MSFRQRGFARLQGLTVVATSLFTLSAYAQVDIQKYSLEKLSFQFLPSANSAPLSQRCLNWLPLSKDEPSLRYDDEGNPYVKMELRGRLKNPGCKVRISNVEPESFREESRDGGEVVFTAIVRPPVLTAVVSGENFKDELIIEAPVQRLDDISFFTFFRKTKVYFETRYATLKTDNPVEPTSVKLFPVFGGSIVMPLPYIERLAIGYSMFQNLGNVSGSSEKKTQYSEFAFDLRYMWTGSERAGRPQIAVVGDYRGRSIYQTGPTATTSRPFVIGSVALPGLGVDASWYPAAAFMSSSHWLSKLGLDFSMRLYPFSKVDGNPFYGSLYDFGFNYRVSRKWAIGGGYQIARQRAEGVVSNATALTVTESLNNYYFRVTLVPFLGKGRR